MKILKKMLNFKNTRKIENYDIDEKELKQLEKQGATILDVRSPQEYQEGHIEGAILLPEYELKNKVSDTIPNKEEIIVVYCSSGIRSKKAQRELKQIGYKNVYNLENGLENY